MKKVEEIKTKRSARHILQRFKKAKVMEKTKDIREVQKNLSLIKSPAIGLMRAQEERTVEEIHESDEEMQIAEEV